MKITWASNAPWAGTGYGTQTKQVLKRLVADGHDVVVAANFGLEATPMRDPDTGVYVFPRGAHPYAMDVLPGIHRLHCPDGNGWIILLYDTWVANNQPELDRLHIAGWAPVDHYPVPPEVQRWVKTHPTIAMSRFGERALKEVGVDPMYAPHALELDVWRPTDTLADGSSVRARLNIPEDAFLVIINAANKGNMPPRKAWAEMLAALKVVMDERQDVFVYLHTVLPAVYGGIDLAFLMSQLGLPPERVRIADQFGQFVGLVNQQTLAAFYSASDVLLATSMGEGFGLTVLEAQACGTPVITTNFSAQPELVGGGWTVGFQPYYDLTQGSYLAMPNIGEIVRALNESYERKGDAELRAQSLAKAAEYDADKVFAEHWRPILARLEEMLQPRAVNRAARRKNKKAA